ncbi:unnamed protein product [Porites evermanni]|uniref:Uncharacterized protein n=1 Tax=Porites evermanni TaxID=104178 RepID=A0ABN8LT54_9CNID|nr:unnamed protein product [Porites evermanni]
MDFLKRDFPEYPWSMRTLDRQLRYSDIFYKDQSVEVDIVKAAVENELKGRYPEGLEAHGSIGAKKKGKKGTFNTRGSNWVHSLDSDDGLMG